MANQRLYPENFKVPDYVVDENFKVSICAIAKNFKVTGCCITGRRLVYSSNPGYEKEICACVGARAAKR
nr:hypothetical protein BaRGS_011789 [Batillaria attramentaria]